MSPLTPPSRVKNPWRTRGLSESRSTAINVLSLLWLPNGNSRTGASEAGFLKPRRHGLPGTGDRQRLEQGAHRRRFDQAAEGRIDRGRLLGRSAAKPVAAVLHSQPTPP